MLGSLMGGVVGDAYGSPYEFKIRDTYNITPNMEYNYNFNVPAGSFTDDSSMMLCLAQSLAQCKGFDPFHQMQNYSAWKRYGFMSSAPDKGCFDIGNVTRTAIHEFDLVQSLKENFTDVEDKLYFGPTGEYTSGNGSVMRLAPIPVFYRKEKLADIMDYAILSSKVTHGSTICIESCALMVLILAKLINGEKKENVLKLTLTDDIKDRIKSKLVLDIANGCYLQKHRNEIKTSGYVIDTLESAMWSFSQTDTFEEGMMLLAAMGNDVDTVCCVYGQIAGSYYGYNSIPPRWIDGLQQNEMLDRTFSAFLIEAKTI